MCAMHWSNLVLNLKCPQIESDQRYSALMYKQSNRKSPMPPLLLDMQSGLNLLL